MRPKILLGSLLYLAATVSLQSAVARGPAAQAPHMSAAPVRMAAQPMHMAAPARMAPQPMHMAAPARMAPQPMHMSQPMHMAQPQHSPEAMHMAASRHMNTQHEGMGSRETAPHAENGRPAEMRHSEPERTAAQHSASQPHEMSHPEARHEQTSNAGNAHEMRNENQSARPGDERAGGQAHNSQEANRASERNGDTHISGMHPNSPPHQSPITSNSPARVQSEHQDAMMQLRQGHTNQQASENNRGMHLTAGHVAAGALAGAAMGGIAAHQMAEQRNGERNNGQNHGPENGAQRGEQGAQQTQGTQQTQGAQQAHGGEAARTGQVGSKGTQGPANVPPSPGYANPRHVAGQRSGEPQINSKPAGQLAYRNGVSVFPREGDKHHGVPGVFDPGGYIRTPQSASTRINQDYARQQLKQNPNWQRDMDSNNRNWVANRGAWPWHLPQQSTWWNPSTWRSGGGGTSVINETSGNPYANGNPYGASPYGVNPYGANPFYGNQYGGLSPYFGFPYGAYGNSGFWNNWNNYDGWNNWNNQYANSGPYYGGGGGGLMGMLGGLLGEPQGVGLGSGSPNDWLANLLYSTGYSTGGNTYPANYFAMNGYVPTPYVFNVASGQFWQPGVGYSDSLPNNYQAPITVSAQEVVPSFDANGNIVGYQPQTFYNDAYWDNDAQSYGYYDYRKKFHWARFPGLSVSSREYTGQ